MHPLFRRSLLVVALVLAAAGCSKASDGDDEDRPRRHSSAASKGLFEQDSKQALVEEHDFGTIGWSFEADGVVKADVRDPSGAPIKDGLSGELKVGPAGKPTTVPLKPVEGTAIYGASVPSFSADLTPVTYVVRVKGKPYTGTIHVPAGGTSVMFASPPSVTVAADAKGPHGGVVQAVGDDRVELVSDDATGEVRAYVLDADLRPMPVGDRRVTIGVVADAPDTVVLVPAPDRTYFSARWRVRTDPSRVTVCVRRGPAVRVAIVGWRPGAHLFVGVRAPIWHVRVHTGWGPPAFWVHGDDWDDDDEGHIEIGGRGHWRGRGWHHGHR